jgi:two-component system response regulator YesN
LTGFINEIYNGKNMPFETLGISSISSNFMHIADQIREANTASCNSFLCGGKKIFAYREEKILQVDKLAEELFNCVRVKKTEQISKIIEKIRLSFTSEELGIQELVYLWNKLILSIKNSEMDRLLMWKEDFMGYEKLLNSFEDINEFWEYFNQILTPSQIKVEDRSESIHSNSNFMQLVEFVDANYRNDLSLKELAANFYMNYSYCCECFKKAKGCTFLDYVTELRMKEAIRLAKNENLTIAEIAEGIGFKDYYYFNKCFKKYYGVSLSEYRKAGYTLKGVE